jgi:hypothetical protein
VARTPVRVEPAVECQNPYRLIADTARRARRRRRWDLLLPGLPPLVALLVARLAGRLPLEVAVAASIAFGVLLLYAASVDVSLPGAAAFLDRTLGAREHFLTLATVQGEASLRPVVEASAIALARLAPEPSLPPRRKRPLGASLLLSGAGFLLLWFIPELATMAAADEPLARIGAELARSADADDRALAEQLREVMQALGDSRLSTEQKLAKVNEAIAKLDEAERKRPKVSTAGSSGGEGEKGDQGRQAKTGGETKGQGAGDQSSTQDKSQGGEQAGPAGDARGRARQELSKLAGELSAQAQAKSAQGEPQTPQPGGGGIQGPQGAAEERETGAQEATGNQPGKSPDKPGGGQKPGGQEGAAKAQPGNQPQGQGASQDRASGGGASTEGTGQRSAQGPAKNAERYFKPGEGPDGQIIDGRYVRIRVPEDQQLLGGTEEVAKPGDVVPEVGYGNAPQPGAGSPGKVSTEQPVPLEYRGVLGSAGR